MQDTASELERIRSNRIRAAEAEAWGRGVDDLMAALEGSVPDHVLWGALDGMTNPYRSDPHN